MSTPEVIPFDRLAAPISSENRAGENLRWDPVYDEIRKAGQEQSRDALGVESGGADWQQVIALSVEALASRSKDWQLAAWLTEALLHRHGFAGLRDGFRLMHQLMEEFWDDLFPQPDDGDMEPRVSPLVWLMEADRGSRLANRIREIPLLADVPESSWSDWKARFAPPKGDDEDDSTYAARKAEAEETERRFEEGVGQVDLDAALASYEEVQEAAAALKELDEAATIRFDHLAPGVSAFRQAFAEIEVLLRRIVRDKGGFAEPEGDEEENEEGAASAGGNNGAPKSAGHGPIASRDDAFRRLAEVAEYLRRTEPQSPVPCLIDRAVAWGRMPFQQLLQEMIRDENARWQVNELLGIRADESSE